MEKMGAGHAGNSGACAHYLYCMASPAKLLPAVPAPFHKFLSLHPKAGYKTARLPAAVLWPFVPLLLCKNGSILFPAFSYTPGKRTAHDLCHRRRCHLKWCRPAAANREVLTSALCTEGFWRFRWHRLHQVYPHQRESLLRCLPAGCRSDIVQKTGRN